MNKRRAISVKRVCRAKRKILTRKILKRLHRKVRGRLIIESAELYVMWKKRGLSENLFNKIMTAGKMEDDIEWLKFLALASSSLGMTVSKVMKILCKVLSSSQLRGPPRMPFSTFSFLYMYLAELAGISKSHVVQALKVLEEVIGPDGIIRITDFIKNSRVKLDNGYLGRH
ncbi:ropporin-1-like [Bombina bombina]|uniref:ropporin-1-like n=1 Tax=Bombina bombina TaxID=8345 RepID=UPI00235A619B|nr:ropporin-1-like [Bombina bombina]